MAAGNVTRRASKRRMLRASVLAVLLAGAASLATVLIWRRFHPPPPSGVSTRLSSPAVPAPLPRLAANQPPNPLPESMPDSPDRVADARLRRSAHLAALFANAGVPYPAREIYLRAFKWEGQLELWARPADNAPFRLVHTYPILCASGHLGPKRREGDGQVPEGFYLVDRFNPRSLFHLSLGLNYPNAADRLLTTDPAHPGSDVFIHGAAASAGCLAMGDAAAEEIYLAAWDARAPDGHGPTVHLFPCRMDEANWRTLLAPTCAGRPELQALWLALRAGYTRFDQTHQLPTLQVDARGRYSVSAPTPGQSSVDRDSPTD